MSLPSLFTLNYLMLEIGMKLMKYTFQYVWVSIHSFLMAACFLYLSKYDLCSRKTYNNFTVFQLFWPIFWLFLISTNLTYHRIGGTVTSLSIVRWCCFVWICHTSEASFMWCLTRIHRESLPLLWPTLFALNCVHKVNYKQYSNNTYSCQHIVYNCWMAQQLCAVAIQ